MRDGPTNVVPFTQAQRDALGVCRTCGGMNGFHDGIETGSWQHPLTELEESGLTQEELHGPLVPPHYAPRERSQS